MPSWVKSFIDTCGLLGALPAAAIWSLTTIVLGLVIYDDKKKKSKSDEAWQSIRLEQAKAEGGMAEAIKAIADVSRQHADEIRALRIIIDERLPRRVV